MAAAESAGGEHSAGDNRADEYPGQRLGLPEAGRGQVAGWGRRTLALGVDWVLGTLGAFALVGVEAAWFASGGTTFTPLVVFAAQVWLLTAFTGASAGQRVLGLQVLRLDRRAVGLWSGLIRTLLICLVIPPVVYDRDYRGLHDKAVGTVVVRR